MKKEYLGDSVYVEVEDGMIKLTTENDLSPSNVIYLEQEVFNNLIQWYKSLEGVNTL